MNSISGDTYRGKRLNARGIPEIKMVSRKGEGEGRCDEIGPRPPAGGFTGMLWSAPSGRTDRNNSVRLSIDYYT